MDIIKYDNLPKGYVLAKEKDFFQKQNIPIIGMKFIMQSFVDNHFQLFTVKESFDIENIKPWLNKDRCWIEKQGEEKTPAEKSAGEKMVDKIEWGF